MPRQPPKTEPGSIKRGRISEVEKGRIIEMAITQNSSAEQIAKLLRRPVQQIRDEINKVKGLKQDKVMTLEAQLELRPEWARFTKQFSKDELEEFKHQYVQIISQMKHNGDIYATEELQVFQVITLKILIDRTMEEQKRVLDDMNQSYLELQELRKQGAAADAAEVSHWEFVSESSKKANKECADRYKTYSDKQDKMLHALKSTRDQRIKVWENSDKSLLGLVRLLAQEEHRSILGEEAEMMKRASQKEKLRLARPHKYDDGTIDQPILSPETVLIDFEEDVETGTVSTDEDGTT